MKRINKNLIITVIGVAIIAIPILILSFIYSGVNRGKETSESSMPSDVADNVVTITYAVPDICRIDKNNLNLLNEEFKKDGLHYRLEIKYLDYEGYADSLANEAKNGNIDIAFTGFGDASGVNNTYKLLQSGLFYDLDHVLSGDTGKVLYNSFPENLWKSVKCDQHTYSIPSTLVNDQGLYVAFNRDYITDEKIKSWNGNLEGLYEMLQNTSFTGKDTYAFLYLITDYSFENLIGCEIRSGLLYDYDTQTVKNPLESDKFIGFLRTLDKMKNGGYMSSSVSYVNNTGLNDIGIRKDIESGNYAIALCSGTTDELFMRDNVYVKRIPGVLSSRINGSIGIINNVNDINAVVDFLAKFYSSDKYGNILIYGLENEHYKVVDGIACNIDGSGLDDHYLTKLVLNLFINLLPVSGEDFRDNRRQEYFSFYESLKVSPFIGFEPDTEHLGNISVDLDDFMSSLNGHSVEEVLPAAKDKFQSDGIDKYLASVRNQWEKYR